MRNTTAPSYRWDTVMRLSEVAKICSDGNKTIEQQMADTLRRWPYYWYKNATVSLVSSPLKSKVCLAYAVEFLTEHGYVIPKHFPRLPEDAREALQAWGDGKHKDPAESPPEPIKTVPEPMTEIEQVEVTTRCGKPTTAHPMTLFIVKVLKEWSASIRPTWSGVKRETVHRVRSGEDSPFRFIDKEQRILTLASSSKDEELSDKSWQNRLTDARKLLRES